MTLTTPPRPAVGPRPGRIGRLKLEHPVRLYVWPALVFLLVLLAIETAAAGEWSGFLLVELPGVLVVAIAVEAARRSSFSTVEVLRRVLESHRE